VVHGHEPVWNCSDHREADAGDGGADVEDGHAGEGGDGGEHGDGEGDQAKEVGATDTD
jgi:hypothetical protein